MINELDGLAKGVREGYYDSVEHAEMVHQNSTAAVFYLEEQFGSRNPHVKALTSKGTVMETIAFRSEETSTVEVCILRPLPFTARKLAQWRYVS